MSRGKWSQVPVRFKAKGRAVPFEFIKGTGEKAQGVVTDENQRTGPSWVLLTVNPDFGGVPASNPTLEFSPQCPARRPSSLALNTSRNGVLTLYSSSSKVLPLLSSSHVLFAPPLTSVNSSSDPSPLWQPPRSSKKPTSQARLPPASLLGRMPGSSPQHGSPRVKCWYLGGGK